MTPFTMSITDTAQMLGIGRTLAYDLIKSGKLTTVRFGGRHLVLVDSIRALLENGA